MSVATQLMVGMGEIQTAKGDAVFTCLGLGSCVGVAMFDSRNRVGGMVHVMLPEAFPDKPVDKPGKFADTGLVELLRQLEKLGATKTGLLVAYAGGAQVFQFGAGQPNRLDVGRRNGEAVALWLGRLGLKVVASDVGGTAGRTVVFSTITGDVTVKKVTSGTETLANLRRA